MSNKKKKSAAHARQKNTKVVSKATDLTLAGIYGEGEGAPTAKPGKASAFDWVFGLIVFVFIVQIPLTLLGVGNYFIYYTPVILFVIAGLMFWKSISRRNKSGKGSPASSPIRGIAENIPLLLFGVFALIMIVSTIVNCPELVTFTALDVRCDGLIPYLGAIAFMFAALSIDSDKIKLWLIRIFIVTASIFNLAYVIKSAEVGGSAASSIAIFVNSNHVGYYLALSTAAAAVYFVFSKTKWEKAVSLILEALGVFALAANNTLGAQLAVAMGLVFAVPVVLLCRGRLGLRGLIPVGVAVIVFASSLVIPIQAGFNSEGDSNSAATHNAAELVNDVQAIGSGFSDADGSLGSGRLERWRMGMDFLKEKPLLGYGAEAGAHLNYGGEGRDRIHNEYLHFALMYGVPAAMIYMIAVLAVFIRGLRYRKKLTAINIIGLCTAFTYAVSAAVGVVIPFIYPFFYIFLGLGYYRKTGD